MSDPINNNDDSKSTNNSEEYFVTSKCSSINKSKKKHLQNKTGQIFNLLKNITNTVIKNNSIVFL